MNPESDNYYNELDEILKAQKNLDLLNEKNNILEELKNDINKFL